MKISSNPKPTTRAFTLIEMIGVLAVIGILAALLVPKIFEAINNARVNSSAVSIATIKTATADHYAKYGVLNSSNGATIAVTAPVTNFDGILLVEQFIDKQLAVKLTDPTNTTVELVPIPAAIGGTVTAPITPTSATASDWYFNLAGSNNPAGYNVNNIAGTVGVAVFMANVLESDAQALNNLIDGPGMGVALGAGPDLLGRVKYTAVQANGLVDMTIYVTHR